jgi:hypothetical protein
LGYHNLWKPLYVGWGMKRNTFKASKKMFHWGSTSSTRLRHQKKKLEPLIFYGACNSLESKPIFFPVCSALEVEPLARKDIGPGNHAFARMSCQNVCLWEFCEHVAARRFRLGQYLQHFGFRTFHFRLLVLNLFKVGSRFLRVGLRVV